MATVLGMSLVVMSMIAKTAGDDNKNGKTLMIMDCDNDGSGNVALVMKRAIVLRGRVLRADLYHL
jgi:hypothetical protein